MANWWDSAPVVGQGNQAPAANWWDNAPIAEGSQPGPREGAFPQVASGMTEGGASFLNAPASILAPLEIGARSIGPAIGNALGGDFTYPTLQDSWLPRPGDRMLSLAEQSGAMTPPSENGWESGARRVGQEIGANAVPMAGIMSAAPTIANALARGSTELGLSLSSGGGAAVANELFPGNPIADLAGQIAGYGAGSLVANGLARTVTPNPMSPEQVATRDYLQSEGVDLSAGQATGNKALQYRESELGGLSAENFMDNQGQQFTNAALKRIGVDAPRATPDVLNKAYVDIGNEFDRLALYTGQFPVDNVLQNELQSALDNYSDLVGASSQAPAVGNAIDDIITKSLSTPDGVPPSLTGEQYKTIRSMIGDKARNSSSSELSFALQDIQRALDDAVERHLAASSPDDVGLWKDVRSKYRDFLTLERAASGAGEKAAQGIITPAQLTSALKQVEGRRSYALGRGDFSELARNGVSAMSPLPNSGTAQRTAARTFFTGMPTIAGALLGQQAGGGDLMAGLAGGFAGAAIPSQVGKALLSPIGRGYLTNQLYTGNPVGGANQAALIARALVAQGEFDR